MGAGRLVGIKRVSVKFVQQLLAPKANTLQTDEQQISTSVYCRLPFMFVCIGFIDMEQTTYG